MSGAVRRDGAAPPSVQRQRVRQGCFCRDHRSSSPSASRSARPCAGAGLRSAVRTSASWTRPTSTPVRLDSVARATSSPAIIAALSPTRRPNRCPPVVMGVPTRGRSRILDQGAHARLSCTPGSPARRSMTDRPRLLQRSDWASHPTLWKGHVEGLTLGTNVTILFYSTVEVGRGPVWPRGSRALHHRRDPDRSGGWTDRLRSRGRPAQIPQSRSRAAGTTDIHVSDRWIQTDLDDPEATS